MSKKRLLQFAWIIDEKEWCLHNPYNEVILLKKDFEDEIWSVEFEFNDSEYEFEETHTDVIELALMVEDFLAEKPDCLGFMAYSSCGAKRECR